VAKESWMFSCVDAWVRWWGVSVEERVVMERTCEWQGSPGCLVVWVRG